MESCRELCTSVHRESCMESCRELCTGVHRESYRKTVRKCVFVTDNDREYGEQSA